MVFECKNEIIFKYEFQILRAPSIRQFSNRMKHIDDCVNLTIGQPDFPMPDVVKEVYINAIKEDKTSYSHKGLPETRQASNYFKNKYGFIIVKRKSLLRMARVKRLIHHCEVLSNLEMRY